MADLALAPELVVPIARPAPDYNEAVVKKFIIAAVFWAIVAFLVGVYLATELAWPQFNLGLSYVNFGRLRPVHTSAGIFAFGGSMLFGTSFYVVQRTCRTRLFGGEALANFVFWGYQFFIVMAALSYVMGYSKSQEYAEPPNAKMAADVCTGRSRPKLMNERPRLNCGQASSVAR